MIEKDFINSIDCKFPYHDKEESKAIIDRALTISDNSMYAVIHENVRLPKSHLHNNEIVENCLDNLAYILTIFDHTLKDDIVKIGKKMLLDKYVAVSEVVELLKKLKEYPGQFSALSILYFSADDKDGEIEESVNDIEGYWKSKGF